MTRVFTSSGGGWGYELLVLLHVTCALGGFGALVYRSFALELGRRRGDAAAAGAIAVFGEIAKVAEALIYGAAVFGLAAVATGPVGVSFGRAWVVAAIADYVVMVGILHGAVRPAENRYRQAMLELAQMPSVAPPARPPQLAELDSLYRRISAGMGVFNLLLIGALYLMVFKP